MKAVQLSYYCQSASPRRMQSQVFQRVRSKDAGIAPAKDRLHHKSKVYIQITKNGGDPWIVAVLLFRYLSNVG